jgi:hypothetical protein
MCLAGEHVALFYFFWGQGVIDIHADLTAQNFRFTRTANTTFTSKWRIGSGFVCGIEYGWSVGGKKEVRDLAIHDELNFGFKSSLNWL